nr:hypothetical protein [Tanacetum cinerariifolium]
MDDPNITMKEYIRLEEEKAQRHGRTFNWQTSTFGKIKYYENDDDCFTDLKIEFPAIAFDNTLTSDTTPSYEPTVSPPNKNEIDFRISLDKSDDEDYTVEGYTDEIVHNFEQRLETIFDRQEAMDTWHLQAMLGGDCFGSEHLWFGQAPKKVTGVDLFYLCSMDRGTANVPHLLAEYLCWHIEGRKSGAKLSGGHFIGRLATHFGLTLVASGPKRQQAATAGAYEADKAGPVVDEGDQDIPAPV